MKRLFSTFLIVLSIVVAQAQEADNEVKTLFGSKNDHSNGGYGALMVGYSQI